TPTTQIYTLSLHDALPILPLVLLDWSRLNLSGRPKNTDSGQAEKLGIALLLANLFPSIAPIVSDINGPFTRRTVGIITARNASRSEEHTSELQSRCDLVCR